MGLAARVLHHSGREDLGGNRDAIVVGGLPDAIALQETLFKDEARLDFAQKATAEYTWLCSPGKKRPVQECNPTVDPGRGSWLLIRKGGPLDGGSVLDLSEWDDQHRVVAVRTALGLLVAYYGPACTNAAAQRRGDGPRYFTSFSSFLKEHKDELLAASLAAPAATGMLWVRTSRGTFSYLQPRTASKGHLMLSLSDLYLHLNALVTA